jgi:hypothetical protein
MQIRMDNFLYSMHFYAIKNVNYKALWTIGVARTKDEHHNFIYRALNFNSKNLLCVVYDTFEKVHLISYVTQVIKTAQSRHTSKFQTRVLPVYLAANYTHSFNNAPYIVGPHNTQCIYGYLYISLSREAVRLRSSSSL